MTKLFNKNNLLQLLIFSFIFCETETLDKNNGKIIGVVINSETSIPIQYATVTIINNESNEIISGELTDINGYFALNSPLIDNYNIEIDFIGFKSYIKNDLKFDHTLYPIFNIGTIYMEPKILEISEIKVNAEKPLYNVTVDKKIYQIDQIKASAGGTCCDVLKKIPSLELGPNGEISLRGSTKVSVLVNGKRTGILGDGRKSCAVTIPIPASMIESIEIITSPSAEYDPDGITGIVNIIVKDEKVSGYNGEISINAGNTNKFNLGTMHSYRNNKIHIFSKLSSEIIEQISNGYYFTHPTDSLNYINFEDNEINYINLGIKYDISDRTLFVSETKFTQYHQKNFNETTTYHDGSQIAFFKINSQINNYAQVYELGFYNNFLNESQLGLEFIYDKQEKSENQDTLNVSLAEYILDLKKMIIKADYYHNLNDNIQYEIGYKGRFNKHNKNYNSNNNIYTFKYNESIHGLYGSIIFNLTEKIRSKAGIRFEKVLTNVTHNEYGIENKIPSNYEHVYPSVYLAYLFNTQSNLKFAYSSRVNRPELKMLDPYQFSNSVDTVGNPNLKPEFVDAFEIVYTFTKNKYKTDVSVYHHDIKNVIQWYNDIDIIRYNNSGKENLNGIDIMLKVSPLNFLDLTFGGNYYKSKFSKSIGNNLNGNRTGAIIRGISMFKINNGGELELSGTYQLPKTIPTGTIFPDGKIIVDIGYQISLNDDRLKLTCKLINILDNDIYEQNLTQITNNTHYHLHSYKKINNRTFYLTIQYKFGSISG